MNIVLIENTQVRKNENGLYNLNDLYNAALKSGIAKRWQRPSQFMKSPSVIQYIDEVVRMLTGTLNKNQIVSINNGGRQQGTWAHELITLRYASWLSPSFEFKVYESFRNILLNGINVMTKINTLDKTINEESFNVSNCAKTMNKWGVGGRKKQLYQERAQLIEKAQMFLPEISLTA